MDGRWSESLAEGDMDYHAIAEALREVSFSGTVVIELAHESDFEITRPLRESWKLSREYVRDVLGY
jgi:sugar phosphate isomerase/epimerase